MPGARRPWWAIALFAVCLLFFLDRGPYRAIRFSTAGDFSTVYAAARCWLHGANPYNRVSLKAELAAAHAPLAIQQDQNINPSVYLPAAMPWIAPFAALPWPLANTLWCLLLLTAFALSIHILLAQSALAPHQAWIAWAAVLLFSPTYVGIYDGNPGVLAISLTTLSICFALTGSGLASGLLLGIVVCFKPQIALCAFCLCALWKMCKPPLLALAVFLVASIVGVLVVSHFGHNWNWWHAEQQNTAHSFDPGGQSDPATRSPVAWQMLNGQTLTAYLAPTRAAGNYLVWFVALALVALRLIRRNDSTSPWKNVAFFAALTLFVTYHRYYDAQLLLLLLPLLVASQTRYPALIVACLVILAFPQQTVLARMIGNATAPSLMQFVLLRNQPAALLILTTALAI